MQDQTKWGLNMMEGGREEQDLGALELVHLLHQPALRSRHVHRAQHLAFSLFTFSSESDFALFTPFSRLPFSSPGLPLHSLSLHLPNCLGGGEEARGRRGGRQPILRSHWSKPAAAAFSLVAASRRSCLGRGDWLQLWTEGCPKIYPADFS